MTETVAPPEYVTFLVRHPCHHYCLVRSPVVLSFIQQVFLVCIVFTLSFGNFFGFNSYGEFPPFFRDEEYRHE